MRISRLASTILLALALTAIAQEHGGPRMGPPPDQPGRPGRIPALGRPTWSVTIVATSAFDKDHARSLEEDIPVMLQILRKNLDRGQGPFQPWELFGIGQGQSQGIYIQGHGLVLLGRAVLAQGQDTGPSLSRPDQASHADPVWRQAQQEIFGPSNILVGTINTMVAPGWRQSELIEQIVRTLRHATNIRGLRDDDLVTICVTSQVGSPPDGSPPGIQAILANGPTFTVQARKADIDLFASGKLTFEQFSQKVSKLIY